MIKNRKMKFAKYVTFIWLMTFSTLSLIINNVTALVPNRFGVLFTEWGSEGSDNGQFEYPYWICTDSVGQVYVSDVMKGVSVFDSGGKFLRVLGSPVSNGVATNASGSVYVADASGNRVWVFSETGVLRFIFGSYGTADGCFIFIQGIAINASGYVYITDSSKNVVQVFTPAGQFLRKWTVFDEAMGIAIAPTGEVYVTTLSPSSVQKYYQNGTFIKNIATAGNGEDSVKIPYGVATDQDGYVYVTDAGNHRILSFDPKGYFISSWGTNGTQSGQINQPCGIAVTKDQYIYVTDLGNHRVLVFMPQAVADFWTAISIILAAAITILLIVKRKTIYSKFISIKGRLADKRERRVAKNQKRRVEEQRRREELERRRKEAEEARIIEMRSKVEKVVLELAPQFSRLQVSEIAERCGVNEENFIIKTVQDLIAKRKIDAVYFKSTKSIGFQQQVIEKPFLSESVQAKNTRVDVRRQYEYVGGKVRLKVKVINLGTEGLLRIRAMLNVPDSFRILRVEPSDYILEGTAVKLQDLLPKEEKAIAYVLEPMICGKEQFSGTISGVDAAGNPFVATIAPLEVEVRCPLFANPEEANLPLVKNMAQTLPVKSERVFYLPDTLSPTTAFEVAKSAIAERDVRHVGSVSREDRKEGDSFEESAWFYGITKVEKKRYVLSAAVSNKDHIIRLATACDDEAGCTGFLAEAGAAVRRELVRRGAFEDESKVIELVCEKCGATLPSAPTIDHDVRCPECDWSWRSKDFFH